MIVQITLLLKIPKKIFLVDFFHSKTYPSKKIVTIPDSVSIYENL